MALSIEAFLGPFLLLICIALILFGVFAAQVYAYWFSYDDQRGLKAIVLFVAILECAHTAFCMHVLYTYFVVDIGQPLNIAYIIWSAEASVYMKVFIVALTQSFSIHRIYQLSGKNRLVTVILAIVMLCSLGSGIATVNLCIRAMTWVNFAADKASTVTLNCSLSISAFLDLIIAALLSLYLHKHKSSFRRTQHLVQRLTFYTINTGALTAAVSIITLVTFNALSGSLVWGGMLEIISKLYANAMLAMLNARHSIGRGGASDSGVNTIPLALRGTNDRTLTGGAAAAQQSMRVGIHKETTLDLGASSLGAASERGDMHGKDVYSLA